MSKHSFLLLTLASTALGAVAINAHAQATPSADRWQAGVVLDGASTSRGLELGARSVVRPSWVSTLKTRN